MDCTACTCEAHCGSCSRGRTPRGSSTQPQTGAPSPAHPQLPINIPINILLLRRTLSSAPLALTHTFVGTPRRVAMQAGSSRATTQRRAARSARPTPTREATFHVLRGARVHGRGWWVWPRSDCIPQCGTAWRCHTRAAARCTCEAKGVSAAPPAGEAPRTLHPALHLPPSTAPPTLEI